MCLLHSLRALGFDVPHVGPGPFWALKDGNSFLYPFGVHLESRLEPPLEAGQVLSDLSVSLSMHLLSS